MPMTVSKISLVSLFARTLGVLLVVVLAPFASAQDAAKGETVFKKCKSCHQVGANAKNRTGPVLNGVVGRAAGSVEGFKYSPDLAKAAENGLVWTEEALAEWLADPRKFLRTYLNDGGAKSKMTTRITREQDRLDVIGYLATQ